jgi:hypothetical protein
MVEVLDYALDGAGGLCDARSGPQAAPHARESCGPIPGSKQGAANMRSVKVLGPAFFAALTFSAMAASTASAFHPLFFTQSGRELLFSGSGGLALLRGGAPPFESVVDCEKTLTDGFALNLSTLARGITVLFEGKCQLTSAVGKFNCPTIHTDLLQVGELGLLTATNHKVVVLLAPIEGTQVSSFTCETQSAVVNGAVVGEIPATNAKGEQQINVARTEVEMRFESIGKTNKQAITEIWLLGTQMTGAHLTAFGVEGSLEVTKPNVVLEGDGEIEISTTRL